MDVFFLNQIKDMQKEGSRNQEHECRFILLIAITFVGSSCLFGHFVASIFVLPHIVFKCYLSFVSYMKLVKLSRNCF